MKLLVLAGWLFFQPPPPDYQADGMVLVQFAPRAAITALCELNGIEHEGRIEACGRPGFVILPDACAWPTRESYAELVCHEKGHGVGRWRHDGGGNTLPPLPPPSPPPPEVQGPER
jgi:hypothetical protein